VVFKPSKMKTLVTLLFTLWTFSVFSQVISGNVIDQNEEPLVFVNVILNDSENMLVKASVSDADGAFSLKNIPAGSYTLYFSLLGYSAGEEKLEYDGKTLDLGSTQLVDQASELEGATVIGEIPIVEVEPDKTVFNVSQNLSSSGNNALELLRMAPGVQVDNDNNIIVEGKSGVIVYIDDRQSYLNGDELKAFLQSMQADEIEKIEIITQPSSRFDAAGNAGIINIILKREKGLGTSGYASSTLTYGDSLRGNGQIGFTSRTKKWVVSGNYSGYKGVNTGFIDLKRTQGDKIFDSETESSNNSFNNNVRFNADYTIGPRSTVGVGVRTNFSESESSSFNNTPILQLDSQILDSTLIANTSENSNSFNLNSNIFYTYKDTVGNFLTADLNYGQYTLEKLMNQTNQYITPNDEIIGLNRTRQNTPIDINIYVGQLDYEKTLKKGTLALGAKASQVTTDNTFEAFNFENDLEVLDLNRTNNFVYDEIIAAAYANYNFSSGKKWKFQTGLRVEHTASEGVLSSAFQDTTVSRNYTNWFPSGGITYTPNFNSVWSFIYSRRIQRPGYQSLNPFEVQLNELSFVRGNPFLQPQYTDNIKISRTYKYTLTTSVSYSYVSDFFAQVTEALGENRNFLISRNVADQQVYNFTLSYPFTIKKAVSVYTSLWANYNDFTSTNPVFVDIDQITYGGYAQATWNISESLSFQTSGWFSSPSIWGGTYNTRSMGALNFALQKNWKKLTAKVSLNDALYTQPWRADADFADLSVTGRGGNDSRTVQLYLSYNFGNKEVKSKKDRKTGSDDVEQRIN